MLNALINGLIGFPGAAWARLLLEWGVLHALPAARCHREGLCQETCPELAARRVQALHGPDLQGYTFKESCFHFLVSSHPPLVWSRAVGCRAAERSQC